jgi:putative transposase
MIKSFKVMLLPNNKQRTKLFDTADASRYAYNWALRNQIESFEQTGKYILEGTLRKQFTEHKNEKDWLYDVSNNATKQALKDACEAFWRFETKRKKPGYKPYSKKKIARVKANGKKLTRYDMKHHPKFKKKGKAQPKFYVDNWKIDFTETHVKLEKIANSKRKNRAKANWIQLAEKAYIPVGVKYTNPRVTYDGINWWISVGVETESRPYEQYEPGIGIDVGVKELAIVSNKTKINNINKTSKVKKLKKKQRRLQRQISRKYEMNKPEEGERYEKTGNLIKSEKQLLKLNHRLTGIRRNHVHQATSRITKQKPSYIVTENLNVQGMMANKHLARAVQEQCLYEFARQIEYKSKNHGIKFIKADRYYASSKLCSNCGEKKKDLKLRERIYKCEHCGLEIDRDYNAAINLKKYGVNTA